jgi:hypothetical protein
MENMEYFERQSHIKGKNKVVTDAVHSYSDKMRKDLVTNTGQRGEEQSFTSSSLHETGWRALGSISLRLSFYKHKSIFY